MKIWAKIDEREDETLHVKNHINDAVYLHLRYII